MTRACYGQCLPGLDPEGLPGRLIVVEGPDAVGRSTQIALLTDWLEGEGHAVKHVGLTRSSLAGPELEAAKAGHELRPYPMALFYAADFFDQLEKEVIPALHAGMIVLADRYVHTLIARALVRGMDEGRIKGVYEGAIVPDLTFYLRAKPRTLVDRMLHKQGQLDYWEAGMDLGLGTDWYDSFLLYQKRLRKTWQGLADTHPFIEINADRAIKTIHQDLRRHVETLY